MLRLAFSPTKYMEMYSCRARFIEVRLYWILFDLILKKKITAYNGMETTQIPNWYFYHVYIKIISLFALGPVTGLLSLSICFMLLPVRIIYMD